MGSFLLDGLCVDSRLSGNAASTLNMALKINQKDIFSAVSIKMFDIKIID